MLKRRAAVISGLGACNGLGLDAPAMNAALGEQRIAEYRPFFADDGDAARHGMPFNPLQVPMPLLAKGRTSAAGTAAVLLQRVIDEALVHAGLRRESLASSRVRMYIGGQGVQPDAIEFAAYLSRNDREDVLFNPSIKQMHSENYSEDRLAQLLMLHYALVLPPLSLATASCSSLSALYLASKAIESGSVDIAVVASWQQVTLFNMMFMGGMNALARSVAQPFSATSEGVMLGGGVAATILESPDHLARRNGSGRLRIEGFAMCQSGGSSRGGQSFSPDFRSISRTISESLERAQTSADQIGCIFMHGNGIRGSDQAELMAVRKVWGEHGIPAVSYKAQLGYQVAASGLTDLAILADAMQQQRLLAFRTQAPLDTAAGVQLHADAAPTPLLSDKAVKLGLGLEGSVAACTLARMA
jgi:3-oxoacyl-(acyl-carrier-protein) synthase